MKSQKKNITKKTPLSEAENIHPETDHLAVKTTQIEQPSQYTFVGASVAGKGHRNEDGEIIIPCQDAHSYCSENGWNVLVVCDGAGSYANSKKGAAFCVEHLPKMLLSKLDDKSVFSKACQLSNDEWRAISIDVFSNLKSQMQNLAINEDIDFQSLGCTVNVALFNNETLLTAHIGDGRAAYKKADGVWEALITPFKGDEPGCTVFITSDYTWENPDECIETKVITLDNPAEAVVLLSDGMESYSFLCYTKKEDEEIYFDPNEPFAPFLDGNISILKNMVANNQPDIDMAWQSYLETGKKLKDEYDDKTLLIAFKS
jgi:hypothetical protein